jgi:hypothetical protein
MGSHGAASGRISMRRCLDVDSTQDGCRSDAVGSGGLSVLHWAVFVGNRRYLGHLLETGVDIRVKKKRSRLAEEMVTEYRNKGARDLVVEDLGFVYDGTRVYRPLSEVCEQASPK